MTTPSDIELVDLVTRTIVGTIVIAGGSAPCLLPNGQLAVAGADKLAIIDLAAGLVVRTVPIPGDPITGITHAPDGTVVRSTPLPGVTAAKVVPHRLQVTLEGTLATAAGLGKFKESAVLVMKPGSGQQILLLDDLVSGGLADAFGRSTLIAHGAEVAEGSFATKRLVQGIDLGTESSAALVLETNGFLDLNDFYAVDRGVGSLQAVAAGAGVFGGLKVEALLNP